MLEYDRIDVLEGININSVKQIKIMVCHYWYFMDIGYKFEPYICNGCYDLMQKSHEF